MIFIENIKRSRKNLIKEYPDSFIIDVSSKADEPFNRLSPFFPHGDIPVPFSTNIFSYSVEGVWQGLKVFQDKDIDISKFEIKNMKGIKRPVRFYGKPLGHRKGLVGNLLGYIDARKVIYVPTYIWMLKNKTPDLLEILKEKARNRDLILLDYTTNENIEDTSKPLAHASIIKHIIEVFLPEIKNKRFSTPKSIGKKTTDSQITIDFN